MKPLRVPGRGGVISGPSCGQGESPRRGGSWVLVVVLVLAMVGSPAGAQSAGFDDVPDGVYYTTPVIELEQAGVFDGTGCVAGFCPDEAIDRKTMAVWVVRILDYEDPPSVSGSRFEDVDADGFHAPFIERMAELGVTRGCGDGSVFCPDDHVTRAQMAAFISRAYVLPAAPDPGFVDVPADTWYAEEVARLAGSGITKGCGDGSRFCPGDDTTRGQMATFLYRAEYGDPLPDTTKENGDAPADTTTTTGGMAPAGDPFSVTIDSATSRAVTGSFNVAVSFARAVTGFGIGGVDVVNGKATGLTGSGSDYEMTIVPAAEGTVVVRIAEGVAHDVEDNPNLPSGLLVRTLEHGGCHPGPGLDTWDRDAVVDAYLTEFQREKPDIEFTGSVASCEAGTTSQAFRDSVVQRVNWYRQMAGLYTVTERPDYTTAAQHAALMMSAQRALSHRPGSDWICYTGTGRSGAAKSNLALGKMGTDGIDFYMRDSGGANYPVGHRRWILYPPLGVIGTGNIPSYATNALYVLGEARRQVDIREQRGFVAWPPAGYVPAEVVWGRWSFQLPGADFSEATVTVSNNQGPIPVEVIDRNSNYGGPAVVWAVYGDKNSGEVPTFSELDCYKITVTNVSLGGTAQTPYQYATCLIDGGNGNQ